MPTALDLYKKAAKDFGVTDEMNVPLVERLSFARVQADEMKKVVNRLLFDVATTTVHENNAKDSTTASAYEGKRRQYENDLRQTVASLQTAIELVNALEKEYTEA